MFGICIQTELKLCGYQSEIFSYVLKKIQLNRTRGSEVMVSGPQAGQRSPGQESGPHACECPDDSY